MQRTPLNTECKLMLLTHAFETLDCIAVEFRTHRLNTQSRRAIERLGAQLDGMLRSHQISPNGSLRDTAVYSIIAAEWPTVRAHLQFQLATPAIAVARAAGGLHHGQEEEPDDRHPVEAASAPARPSLAPDGAQAVCSLSSYSMQDNKSSSALWLLSTLGGDARALTHCGDKDGQPQWSPKGDLIAFVAKREQQGRKDDEAQLYVIAPDGGEARRVGHVATGVEAFAWFPDGRRIAFVSWVWPDLKGAHGAARRPTRPSRSARKAATSPARRSTATGTATCRWAACRTCW